MDVRAQDERVSQVAESGARKLFWGSLLLNVLIVVHMVYLARSAGGILAAIQTFLPAVLLWSLSITAYSFYALNTIARQRAERLARAFTDLSTGIFNLDYLKSYLHNERKRALEMGTSAAIVYTDMVNLDRVNQAFGHAVGDIVLKALAQLIANNVRRGDVVGRVGGDEFLIVMPETTANEAQAVVKAIRNAVQQYRLELGKRGTIDFLGCKTGVAVFPAEGDTPDEIVAAARKKLDGGAVSDIEPARGLEAWPQPSSRTRHPKDAKA